MLILFLPKLRAKFSIYPKREDAGDDKAKADDWKSRYEHFTFPTGTVVYRPKRPGKAGVHYICPHCFDGESQKSILQPGGELYMYCHRCRQSLKTAEPPKAVPAAASDAWKKRYEPFPTSIPNISVFKIKKEFETQEGVKLVCPQCWDENNESRLYIGNSGLYECANHRRVTFRI